MEFEKELAELIQAALDAGVTREAIIEALEERANFLEEEKNEESDG